MMSAAILAGFLSLISYINALSAQPVLTPTGVVTIDWAHTETLLAIGAKPLAVAQPAEYRRWVMQPALPDDIPNIGLRMQPNLEALASLQPDRILVSPQFAGTTPRLEKIAPVTEVKLFTARDVTWNAIKETTLEVTQAAGMSGRGQRLVEDAELTLQDLKQRITKKDLPILMVQFLDANHVRVFGPNSLFDAMLTQLGLQNAWQDKQLWGFSVLGLEHLIHIRATLVVIEPLPVGGDALLNSNQLWQAMKEKAGGHWYQLPPVWSFGGLPSALRFAQLLVTTLESDEAGQQEVAQ